MSTHELRSEPERPREAQAGADSRQRRTGWHPVNTGHLVMGVAFLGLVVVWALVTSDTVDLTGHGWVMGLPWLVAGAVGLVATVLRGPRDHVDHYVDHHGDHHGDHHVDHRNHGSGTMHGWQ